MPSYKQFEDLHEERLVGNVWVIRTDNSTNFVGASAELNKAFSETNHKKINEFMLEHVGQWIQLKRNPPTASNMGKKTYIVGNSGDVCNT